MEESILNTIKKMLGVDPSYMAFDTDIIVGINSALMALFQIGVGSASKHTITGYDETWAYILGDTLELEPAKEYVYIKTRLAFDPPTNSSLIDAMDNMASELEWRLNVQVEPAKGEA